MKTGKELQWIHPPKEDIGFNIKLPKFNSMF